MPRPMPPLCRPPCRLDRSAVPCTYTRLGGMATSAACFAANLPWRWWLSSATPNPNVVARQLGPGANTRLIVRGGRCRSWPTLADWTPDNERARAA